MPPIRETFKRLLRKGAGGQQKQEDIPPAAPSGSSMPEDSSATGSSYVPREQSRGISPSPSPTTTQQSPAAQSLWDRAYNALAKENPDLVRRYDELLAKEEQMANSAPSETALPQPSALHGLDIRSDRSRRQIQLNTVIQNGLKRMQDNKAMLKIAGRDFVLEDQITKASKFLLWCQDWVGSAVKNSPEASIVWSGICLIMPLLTYPTTAAEANRDGFVFVTSRLRYYVALETLLRRLGQNAGVDEAVISAANDHIVDLYQAILNFQLSSVLRFYQSRLKAFVHDIVPLKDWDQTLLDIKTREGTVNGDIGQINSLAARQELESLNRTSEETRAIMENMLSVATHQLAVSREQLAVSREQLAAQLAAREDAQQARLFVKQRKCLQAFYLTQNGTGATYDWYKDRVELRVKGTCKWFLQHERFQEWLLQESGPLLVTADPGCGKSVLAKYLIDHGLVQQSATICYFFFTDHDQNTIRQALCALLHQLFSQKSALIQHAMALYNKLGAKLIQSEESLWTILRDALRDPQAGPVIFVIDALDECDESQLSSLTMNLANMFRYQQLANAKFKVLMTSRPYEQVGRRFRMQDDFPRIHIPGEEEFETISLEINHAIHHRVEQLAQEHQLSDMIKSYLYSQLLATNHRTYLWVCLVFDYLDKGFKETEDGIDAVIQELPESVNQAYDQILNRSRDDKTAKTVKKALCIMLAARRPLTLSEMNIAMSLDGPSGGRTIYDLDIEQDSAFETSLRRMCGLFVNVHHDMIYFLHQTAREFLIQSSAPTTFPPYLQWQHSITTRHAHSVLAEICMFYLDTLNSTPTETIDEDDQHGALLEYSVEHWGDHYREAEFETGSAMVDLASRLCTPDLTSHSKWASIISERYHIRLESSTSVLVASHLGLAPVAESLLSSGADVEARDDDGTTALMLAARFGHDGVTRLLLEKGADIDAMDKKGRTAFMHAADSGHEAVTRLLLENGAAVETKDTLGTTALMLAAKSGHDAVARLLLKSGANIETRDNDGTTALFFVDDSYHEAITRMFLESGANVKAKDKEGRTKLMIAAESGDEIVTRLLLEYGADTEAKDSRGRTALMLAAQSGHESSMRILLESGAIVEARDTDGMTALMLAADVAVTRLLLERGAVVEARDNRGRTALMFAAQSGHEASMNALLENKAKVQAKDDAGRTALMLAAESGHDGVTRLLLEKGASVKLSDNDGTTALIFAARSGHENVTRLLLEHGTDIEESDNDGRTALMHAARFDREAIMRMLLNNGADIDAMDKKGRTALMHAADSGHEAVTRLLLEMGASVELSDNDGTTALMFAARSGHENVMRLLLEKGADIEAKDGDGTTALILAARFGDEAFTRLLLESGANVDAMDNKGRTALMHAAVSGHEAVTRLLLEMGADVEAMDTDGTTALIYAAKIGHEGLTRLLFENGADVKARNGDGMTALMLAARSGHEVVTRLLIANGVDVAARDGDDRTALMHAADSGHEDVARLLLGNGADVSATDSRGRTALMHAADSGYETSVRLLLENGASIEARDVNGRTLLMHAAESGHEAVTQLLLETGADVSARDDDGTTALMYAARFGHESVTRRLLENGADVAARDNDGMTALIFAARFGHEGLTRLLLENDAAVEARDDVGMTALLYAAESGHETIARLLLENGANVEARDEEGWSALRYAARFGHEAVTRLLLDKGAQRRPRRTMWKGQRHEL